MSQNITHLRPQKINTVRVLNDAGLRGIDSFKSFGFPSLSAAVADLPTNGGTVFIELGTKMCYEVTTVNKAGVHIVGAGRNGTILQAYNSAVNPIVKFYEAAGFMGGSIRDLTLFGNNVTNSVLQIVSPAKRIVVDNCRLLSTLFALCLIDDATYNTVRDCYFDQDGYGIDGVLLGDAAHANTIENCYFDGVGSGTGPKAAIRSAVYDGSGPSNRQRILNNIFASCSYGVHLLYGQGHSIMNNQFLICTNGLSLGDASNSVTESFVEANYFYGCSYEGWYTNIDRCYIGAGNRYDSPGTMAITIGANSLNNIIWNLSGSTLTDSGTGNVIIDKATTMLNLKAPEFAVNGIIKPLTNDNNGIAVRTGAGAPSDTTGGNQDGCLYLDTTNHRLYVRDGGAWKYAGLT